MSYFLGDLTTTTINNNNNNKVHKKRPHYQSPMPSFRTVSGGVSERSKRARWDVSSPMPSPPILSAPLPSGSGSAQKQKPAAMAKPFVFATSPSQFQFGLEDRDQNSRRRSSSPRTHFKPTPKRHRLHNSNFNTNSKGNTNTFADADVTLFGSEDDDATNGQINYIDGRTAAIAFDRLRRSVYDEGEVFVERMREWERTKKNFGRSGGAVEEDGDVGRSRSRSTSGSGSGASSSTSTSPPPSMSNSITSNSTFSSSSEAVGRKRSWSIVEDDDDDEEVPGSSSSALGMGDMEWEVLSPPSVPLVPTSTSILDHQQHGASRKVAYTAVASSPTLADASPQSSSSSPGVMMDLADDQDGDDEGDDNSPDDSTDSEDDDIVFVLNNKDSTTAPRVVPTERMLEDLSHALAAGAGGIDDFGVGRIRGDEAPGILPEAEVGDLWE